MTNKISSFFKDVFKKIKKLWNHAWYGEGPSSWILAVVIIYVFVQFIFYPSLGFVFSTSHPIVAVVSGSMEHKITPVSEGNYHICGELFSQRQRLSTTEFFAICGDWYENLNITYSDFSTFPFSRGINTGDVIFLRNPGSENIQVGDVIVFIQEQNPSREPIIHRVVAIRIDDTGKRVFQTKGDHNKDSIVQHTAVSYLNELEVTQDQLVGRAVFRVPYIGYVKLIAYRSFVFIRGLL